MRAYKFWYFKFFKKEFIKLFNLLNAETAPAPIAYRSYMALMPLNGVDELKYTEIWNFRIAP